MLEERRLALRLSRRALADKVGCSHVFLGDVAHGKNVVSASLAERLSAALNLDLAVILCAFRVVPEHAAAAFFDVDRMRAALAGGGQ
jgi:transcriptional regulator with XRE-family HTH domain